MSTYLVAVVVGVFDHIEETTADGMHLRQTLLHLLSFSFSFWGLCRLLHCASRDQPIKVHVLMFMSCWKV